MRYLSGPWSTRLLFASIVFLPFQQAVTLDLGFPLKLTEIFGVLGIALVVVERWRDAHRVYAFPLLATLAILVIASSARAAIWPPSGGSLTGYPRGLMMDLALYTGYALLALAYCVAVVVALDLKRFAKALNIAVILAVAYAVVQFITWLVGTDVLAVLNGTTQLGSLYGVQVPRNATFLEGNYLGFFALTALFILIRSRHWPGVAASIALLLYSQSTGAFVAAVVSIAAIVILRPNLRTALLSGALVIVGVLLALFVPVINRMAVGVLTKLGLIENSLGEAYGYSLRGRTANAETGFAMAAQHPLLGVGPGRYGYHYDIYLDRTGLPENFGLGVVRPIANNVYAQIAAELGFIALAVFVVFLVFLLWRVRKESAAAVGLVAAACVGMVAFPSWTALSLWAVIAAVLLMAASARSAGTEQEAPHDERQPDAEEQPVAAEVETGTSVRRARRRRNNREQAP